MSYSIEGHDGVISGAGMTYQQACREAQREADRTGKTWHVVDEDGYREPVEPCGAPPRLKSVAPAFVCRSEAYDQHASEYASVDDFLAMCRASHGAAPELVERGGNYHDATGELVLEAL